MREASNQLILEFVGPIWYWKGPAPHHFVTVPPRESAELQSVQRSVSYGWGMIPVAAQIGGVRCTTSLFPKDGGFIVPIKAAIRSSLQVGEGDRVAIRLTLDVFPDQGPWAGKASDC